MIRAVLAALAFALSGEAEASTHVISIGNNQGRRSDAVLRYAERDAERVLDTFRRLARVDPDHAVLVSGKDAESVRGILIRTNARLRASDGEEHTLIVYYSGHADAGGLHLSGSTLPFDEVRGLVESSPARVRILILDSCRSGGATQRKGALPAEPFVVRIAEVQDAEGLAIITSSSESEDSQESAALGSSFFTHHFLNALRGTADENRDQRVTLAEAYSYSYRETLRSTGRTAELQHPTYLYDLRGTGEVVLTHLGDDRARSASLSITDPGSYLVFQRDASGPIAADLTVGDHGAEIILQPGRYAIQRRADTFFREFTVELDAGQRQDLSKLPYLESTYARLVRKGAAPRSMAHAISVSALADGRAAVGGDVAFGLLAGYALELEWLTVGLQVRWSRGSGSIPVGVVDDALGLRLRGEHHFDLSIFSLVLGLFGEALVHRQRFETAGLAPSRTSFGGAFGAIAGMELDLFAEGALRIEGGPITHLYRRAVLRSGAVSGSELATPFSWYAALSVIWRLW